MLKISPVTNLVVNATTLFHRANTKRCFTVFLASVLLCFSMNIAAKNTEKPAILQGIHYQKAAKELEHISNYYLSEKLDGMRGYWNGHRLISRQGYIISSPAWFTSQWPKSPMDGELWMGRESFQTLMSCVKKKKIAPKAAKSCWHNIRFMVFDLPSSNAPFNQRVEQMLHIKAQKYSPYLDIVKQFTVNNLVELYSTLDAVIAKKGEGLMLHLSTAYYVHGRSKQLIKLKKHQDGEATVIQHIKGKGKYQQAMGALLVKTSTGITFKIGSGFTDAERRNPPAIGSIISYKYNGTTQKGIPRFARYWRVREEIK